MTGRCKGPERGLVLEPKVKAEFRATPSPEVVEDYIVHFAFEIRTIPKVRPREAHFAHKVPRCPITHRSHSAKRVATAPKLGFREFNGGFGPLLLATKMLKALFVSLVPGA